MRRVEIIAPSRLHFGLLSFGMESERQYGGVGVMIDEPATRLSVTASARFEVTGIDAPRTERFARRVIEAALEGREPACRITLHAGPTAHAGLGSGTQLGMAVAAALAAHHGLPTHDPAQLARWAGRGERSAVGLYGFVQGGLIMEEGKPPGEEFSRLVARYDLPEAWRFVLLRPRGAVGLSGDDERAALSALPAVPRATTIELVRLAVKHLLPAAEDHNFDAFSEALYEYGRLAGSCFAPRQGGPFASRQLATLIDWLRNSGVAGVGQSSWGPTLYALTEDQAAADELVERLLRERRDDDLATTITPINRRGAQIHVDEGDGG